MDDATFRELMTRTPFGACTDAEWNEIASRLLTALSRFLGVPLEFVGNRRPDGDTFVPLVRSVGETPLGVRLGGMMECSAYRDTGLRTDALLFVFVAGERVAPPRLHFLITDYLGPDAKPQWAPPRWRMSDFAEQWDPYTYRRFFDGAETELPGCSKES
jgi:hypothetical protein